MKHSAGTAGEPNTTLTGESMLPALRFRTAQTWWLASELVRRHPHLRLDTVGNPGATVEGSGSGSGSGHRRGGRIAIDDGGARGAGGSLTSGAGSQAGLLRVRDASNRVSVVFGHADGISVRGAGSLRVTWPEVFGSDDSLRLVARMERAAGLPELPMAPVASPHSLVYRVIAHAVASGIDDRREWSAVPAPISAADVPGSAGGAVFTGFSTTVLPRGEYARALVASSPDGAAAQEHEQQHEPEQPFWALLRDREPAAIFDTAGVAHTVLGSTELLACYEGFDRELSRVTARILGAYLP